ncbi:MAG: hypothetical protein ILA04_07030 [Prevotella sp.]|nr:hypothetical protein [Prevotella sp.]
MKQKILLIIALFAIVAGARAQRLYKSNVVVEKNELLESNVTIWKRWARPKIYFTKELLDARLQDLAQRPTEIKDIEYYETGVTYPEGTDENGNQIRKPYYNLIYYQKEVGNVRNSFRGTFDLYKNPDGTPHHAVVKSLEEGTMSSGDIAIHWIINEVTHEGLTYPVTEVGDEVCWNGNANKTLYARVVGITMPNLTTVGEASFYNGAGDVMLFQNLETLNLPNLTTVGDHSFHSGGGLCDAFSSLKVLNLPNLETVGEYAFSGGYYLVESVYVPKLKKAGGNSFVIGTSEVRGVQHTNVYLPIDVLPRRNCFQQRNGGITFHILDNGGKINNLSAEAILGGVKSRFLVPSLGKAQALAELWSLRFNYEVYSPVPVSKANDGYGTMVIEPGDAWASYTQDGVTYANYYDFNRALTAADVEKPFDGTDFNVPEDYRHKWFVATSYTDNNKQEGTLTITSPFEYGVRPGDGFLLQGPAFSGTGDGVMWVPVATVPDDSYSYLESPNPYTDTNYFKAGTGAAVAKESDGCRNFYYTSPTGFWECRNTVIPTNRAYLALPSEMTANAKQISFVIDDGEGEVTGVVNVNPDRYTMSEEGELVPCQGDGAWYTLEGFRLQGKPTTKGIYLHNGRKEVIK